MALLKNLQEVYSKPDGSDASDLTFEDLEQLVEGDDSRQPVQTGGDRGDAAVAAVAAAPASQPRQRHRKRARSRSKHSLMARLKGALVRPFWGSAADEIANLRKRNERLADRLESLEDRSWEVRESEEIHRSISAILGDLVLHRSGGEGGGYVLFSNAICDRYFDDQVPPPEPESSASKIAAFPDNDITAAADITHSRDIEVETLLGRRWFRWTDFPVRDPQTGQVAIRSVARDITQQKTSEQEILAALSRAEQANAAKSRFLAMVSHEIRTPLNGIIGMAGLMRDSQLAPDQKSYVDAISSSGDTLLNLIEDLLDTARIESGQIELAPRACDLRPLVEGVAELLAPVAQEKGLELASFVDPTIPPSLLADSGRLRQVLLNLAGNAVKFTKTGGVGIEVTHQADINDDDGDSGGAVLTFAVRDSGPGLAEADQQRIFEEFVQTDEGATREHGGAGLGLAISKNLVELMGGRIGVTSRLGRGTTFEFTVRLDQPDEDVADARPPVQLDQKVAVILNRNPARQALVLSLRALGARVSTFDSAQAFQINDQLDPVFDAVIAPFVDWNIKDMLPFRDALVKGGRLINISDVTVTAANPTNSKLEINAWLTRPVRQQTLVRVLSNQMKLHPSWQRDDDETPDGIPALDILLAEDNPINALLAQSLLSKMGHQVTHVENGQLALEQLHQKQFDLLLLDLHMPVMDGLTTLEKMRTELDDANRTPVVVLSADGQEDVREAALNLGAVDFLIKPIDPQNLSETLQSHAKSATA
ncbi:MAG: response regulator [Rhizobiaceae bacterium]|nr:ATP-binding protein [Hyphomicrobiales bacterium]NRB30472.1 response regulator [Rhizobiaceae bacterium]